MPGLIAFITGVIRRAVARFRARRGSANAVVVDIVDVVSAHILSETGFELNRFKDGGDVQERGDGPLPAIYPARGGLSVRI